MKKVTKSKKNPHSKKEEKVKDSAELRKPLKLKPLKEKEKKNWKNALNEEDEDFDVLPEEDDLKFDDNFSDDGDDDDFYDDNY